MRPVFKDALKYAFPVAAVLASAIAVVSWYSGNPGWQNYAFAMTGASLGFFIGFAFGGFESRHTYNEDEVCP